MDTSSSGAYIKSLLKDEKSYAQAMAAESNAWGHLQLDQKRQQIIAEESAAGKNLNLQSGKIEIVDLLRRHGLLESKALILGCGEGNFERSLIALGFKGSVHGIDISQKSIASAREKAQHASLTYSCQDINALDLNPDEFDLVFAINSLHHILRLEHVIPEIYKGLKPDGKLYVNDFIGESQFQWLDKRLEIVNAILSLLPDNLKFNKIQGKVIERFDRKPVGSLVSPFEAIRSGEIEPIIREYFEPVEEVRFDSILHFLTPLGSRANFTTGAEAKAVFDLLTFLDAMLVNENILPALGLQCLYAKKSVPSRLDRKQPAEAPKQTASSRIITQSLKMTTPRGTSMDLRKLGLTADEQEIIKNKFSYQPFIHSDAYRTGSGYQFLSGEKTRKLNKETATPLEWEGFSLANDRLAYMYDAMIEETAKNVSTPLDTCEVLDISCNEGYFLYRFLERGVAAATGHDILDMNDALTIIARKLNGSITYNRVGYDQTSHTIPHCRQADIVISTAFMCHLSDPTYHLAFLASQCRDTLLLYTAINDDTDYSIRYGSLTNLFFDAPFPCCFDSYTSVSLPLLNFGLTKLGFTKIVEVKQDGNWIPIRQFRAFVATRK